MNHKLVRAIGRSSFKFSAPCLSATHTDGVGVSLKTLELARCLGRVGGDGSTSCRVEEKTHSSGTGACDQFQLETQNPAPRHGDGSFARLQHDPARLGCHALFR